ANETGTLPNSRRLLAGTSITFDDSVAGQRTINSSAGGGTVTGSGTTNDLAMWTSSSAIGNFAGASCSAGQFASSIAATGALTCSTPPGGGSGALLLIWTPGSSEPPASSGALIDTVNDHPIIAFPSASNTTTRFRGIMPSTYVASG